MRLSSIECGLNINYNQFDFSIVKLYFISYFIILSTRYVYNDNVKY